MEKAPKFNVGQVVIYQNGDKFKLGIIKSITAEFRLKVNGEPGGEFTRARVAFKGFSYFVNYHTGENAARTPENHMHEISNAYAFDIRKLQVYEGYR